MNAVVMDAVNALRTELEPLEWPERFEQLAKANAAADDGVRNAIVAPRGELAVRALAELGPGRGSGPFKDSIRRLTAVWPKGGDRPPAAVDTTYFGNEIDHGCARRRGDGALIDTGVRF